MLTEVEIKFQADQAWRYLIRNPKAIFDDWATPKDFTEDDRDAILVELHKPQEGKR